MVKNILQLSFVLAAFNFAFAQNVKIVGSRGKVCEPSIEFDQNNPDIVVAGTLTSGFHYSSDGGKTWTGGNLTSKYGVWGDPVIEVDNKGHFYYSHLSNYRGQGGSFIDRLVVQKSTDGGKTWTDGVAIGKDGSKGQDKQWTVVDRKNDIIYMTWTQFDKYGSTSASDKSIIRFTSSRDGGKTWSTPIKINKVDGDCVDDDDTVEGAVPAVGPNGEVYVAWAGPNGIVFNKSTDQGKTWLNSEIKVNPMPTGWNYKVPGIQRSNGLPFTKCDLSNGPNRGAIYVNWTDQRNGSNDTDVFVAKSTDGGNTWEKEVRVNDDPAGKHQFFTSMDIDQTTGYLYCVFYDRRNHRDENTDVYLAVSKDGAKTWENTKISESPFKPNSRTFFGDYTDIAAHKGIVRPIWTRLDSNGLSVWTDISPNLSIKKFNNDLVNNEVKQYPNPSTDISFVSYKLRENAKVSLELFDVLGKKVYTILDKQDKPYGKYIEMINVKELDLPTGTYFCKLTIGDSSKTLRTIVVEEE